MKHLTSILLSLCIVLPASAEKLVVANKNKEITILPHRAFYSVKLESATKDSSVSNTDGRMIIELSHDCDGWTLKQESASFIDLKSNESEVMRSVYTARESEDGKILNFSTERVFNEETKDSVKGSAVFTENGGTISYQSPEMKYLKMSKGTMPPIAHMKKLIQSAQEGEKNYSVPVFDGSFYGNPVQIDAFIGGEKGNCKITSVEETVYPMSLAVYAMPSNASNPNFEIQQNMGNNGIMCSYKINFGDYTVKGTLDRVEMLPNKSCAIKK